MQTPISRKNFAIPTLLVLIIIFQNPPWFIWSAGYWPIFLSVSILTIFLHKRIIKNSAAYASVIPTFIALFSFFVVYQAYYGYRFSTTITLITYILLFLITKDEKLFAQKILTIALSVIILLSLPFWLIEQLKPTFPFEYMNYGEGKGDAGKIILKNYFFFISSDFEKINRFYSVFDEPGVLGTLSAFVLFANRYDFRVKWNFIILFGGFFSFSLAFYSISFIGYLFVSRKRISIKKIIALVVVIFFLFLSLYKLPNLAEAFDILIIDRAFNIEESGINSRGGIALNEYYSNYITSFSSFLGKGIDFFSENPILHEGQNYKIFLIEYGFLGLFLVFTMYLTMIRENISLGFICILIFGLSFLQRPFMFTPWQLVIFSITFASLNENHLKSYLSK